MWNLIFIQLLLEDLGHRVRNLGPCATLDLVRAECGRRRPDLLVISTINGHGHRDGLALIADLRADTEFDAMPIVIGGQLSLTDDHAHRRDRQRELLAAGYDRVFEGGDSLPAFHLFLDTTSREVAGAAR